MIPITDDLLSHHILLLGGIGSGKTNTFNLLLRNIRAGLTDEDVVVIFDSKGDFYKEFYRPGDIVFS
ncbi:MAG: type IV secretion system DNA-binding domain-containing protein, partial [Clostridiales bacterium]|nr:type IV secretion system DNA-binding domain-containing protein [Clostridiales bacterium]